MTEPIKRSPAMQSALDDLSKAAFGTSNSEAISSSICINCKKPVNPETDFTDEVSKREYGISGLCQACQDEFFACFDEDDED